EWTSSESGATFTALSPATGAILGTVPEGTRADAQRAIAAARAAQPAWAARTPFERGAILERTAEVIRERRDALAQMLTPDRGKPPQADALVEVDDVIESFRIAAADGKRLEGHMPASVDPNKRVFLQRVPRGVVGLITPWNWPYEMPAEVIAPALASGNAVVWAPAPSTAVSAIKLAECLVDAGLPAGLLNLVTGPGPVVGDELAANPGTH